MRHNQVIYLIDITTNEDEIGNQVEAATQRRVFANEFSISSLEYYNAAATGLRPSKRFELYSFEYRGESKLKHEEVTYRILRTEGRGEKIHLICERVAADG